VIVISIPHPMLAHASGGELDRDCVLPKLDPHRTPPDKPCNGSWKCVVAASAET
jgi:hypothetical protein